MDIPRLGAFPDILFKTNRISKIKNQKQWNPFCSICRLPAHQALYIRQTRKGSLRCFWHTHQMPLRHVFQPLAPALQNGRVKAIPLARPSSTPWANPLRRRQLLRACNDSRALVLELLHHTFLFFCLIVCCKPSHGLTLKAMFNWCDVVPLDQMRRRYKQGTKRLQMMTLSSFIMSIEFICSL